MGPLLNPLGPSIPWVEEGPSGGILLLVTDFSCSAQPGLSLPSGCPTGGIGRFASFDDSVVEGIGSLGLAILKLLAEAAPFP